MIERLQARLLTNEVPLREAVAATNYSSNFNYAFLERRGITSWIPAFKRYKPTIDDFTYLPEQNAYQ